MTFNKIELIVRATISNVETIQEDGDVRLEYKDCTMFIEYANGKIKYANNPEQACVFDADNLTKSDIRDIARAFKNFFKGKK